MLDNPVVSHPEYYDPPTPMLSVDRVIGAAVDLVGQALSAEKCSLMLVSGKPPSLFIKEARGLEGSVVRDARIRVGDGIAGWVALHGEPILARDAGVHPELKRRHANAYATASFVSAPIKVEGTVAGVLNAADKRDGSAFDDEDLRVLQHATCFVGELLGVQQSIAAFQKLSLSDPLTDLPNRRYFDQRLAQELARAQRTGQSLSLLLCDVDDFERVNVLSGHVAANQLLRAVANAIKQTMRQSDIALRYGGDEFAIILPHTGVDGAITAARRCAVNVSELPCREDDGYRRPLSLSIGISSYPTLALDTDQLASQADAALALAKATAMDRIQVWREPIDQAAEAQRLGIPQLAVPFEMLTSDVARLIPLDMAWRYRCVPIGCKRGKVAVAMANPTDGQVLEILSAMTRRKIYPVLSSHADLFSALSRMSELQQKYGAANVVVRRRQNRRREVRIALRPLVAGADLAGVVNEVLEACLASGAQVERAEPYLIVADASVSGCASLAKALGKIESLLVESTRSEERSGPVAREEMT